MNLKITQRSLFFIFFAVLTAAAFPLKAQTAEFKMVKHPDLVQKQYVKIIVRQNGKTQIYEQTFEGSMSQDFKDKIAALGTNVPTSMSWGDEKMSQEIIDQLTADAPGIVDTTSRVIISHYYEKPGVELTPEAVKIKGAQKLGFARNPENGRFSLSFQVDSSGDADITVQDVADREVYRETLKDFSGTYQKEIDLPAGKATYTVKIRQGDLVVFKKILVE